MQKDVIVIENFYDNPHLIRDYAINQLTNNYYDSYPRSNIRMWNTSKWMPANECPFKSSKNLIEKLEFYTGEKIDIDQWNADFPIDWPIYPDHIKRKEYEELAEQGKISCKWNCSFHLKLEVGAPTQKTSIHTHAGVLWDDVKDYGWAGIIYLNPNMKEDVGLYTWKNKLGKDYRYMSSAEEWQREDIYAPVFNRLVLIRGKKPHSGADGYSNDPATGRLFQTLFFRIKNNKPLSLDPVKIF